MYTTSGVYILENVIWEKEYEKGKRKREKLSNKQRKGKENWEVKR